MFNRTLMSMLAFAFVLTFTAQGLAQEKKQPGWMTSPAKEMIDKARASVKQVTIQDLKKAMDSKEDIVILDVRNPNEYDVAHIPGAINVSRGLLEFQIWSAVPDKNAKIFVYCKTGGGLLSPRSSSMSSATRTRSPSTPGGVAWVEAGYPVLTSISDEEIILMPVARAKTAGQ